MIRYFSLVLIILFFLQSSFNTLVYIQFKMQQNYIESELCMQKDVRMNTCKGNCYLKAHLQKEHTDSGFSFSYLKEKVDLYFNQYYFEELAFCMHGKTIYENIFYEICIQEYPDIFHPPA